MNDKLAVFAPFVKSYDLTSVAAGGSSYRHGSMVTSALLYGSIDPAAPLPDPTANVDHYRVFPLPPLKPGEPDHRLYDVLDQMKATLTRQHYPLVVLAIGPNDSLDENAEPDRFTVELDTLAFENGITFITAVGNNGELDTHLGYDRVQPPGDMVNGIGVGAITRKHRDPKKRWKRAPYSARGPGREGQRVQPLIVEFGGSNDERFIGFDERGRLTSAMGTSFASPTTGRAAGGLQAILDRARHRPDIFRAFAVHHAERGHGHGKHYCELGYGRVLADFNEALECDANEVTVLFEDELPRAEPIAHRFPLPKGLPPATRLELNWTVSYISEVDPRDATDYTLSGIEAIFRPDSRKRTLTDPATNKGEAVCLQADHARVTAAITAGWRLSEEPTAHSSWALTKGEQKLRREGKWETIMPGRVLLAAGDLYEPRLDLTHIRRENGRLVRGNAIKPLRFSMLLTIRTRDGEAIYDQIAAQYRVLTPLVRVPLRVSTVA
ncbi:MAG TPA: S8 family serine peptidase [Thermomicrobiales bacterium]|nr:S8 family serine peptidase [Thermomicrobiales bacterium]